MDNVRCFLRLRFHLRMWNLYFTIPPSAKNDIDKISGFQSVRRGSPGGAPESFRGGAAGETKTQTHCSH